jgi:hypothetical protein
MFVSVQKFENIYNKREHPTKTLVELCIYWLKLSAYPDYQNGIGVIMTFLSMSRFGGEKKTMPRIYETANQNRRVPVGARVHDSSPQFTGEEGMIKKIDEFVEQGRQNDLTMYFTGWENVPQRVGDWSLRVNIRRQDGVPVARTIVAIPLSVRSRRIFEKGCLEVLRAAGFSDEDAKRYYKAAWKKKYCWVDSVISATKEMIDAFQVTNVLESFEESGDPRRLAAQVSVPKNPYLTSHAHFLVAVDLAICIIKARQAEENTQQQSSVLVQQDKPEVKTSNVVLA